MGTHESGFRLVAKYAEIVAETGDLAERFADKATSLKNELWVDGHDVSAVEKALVRLEDVLGRGSEADVKEAVANVQNTLAPLRE